MPPSTNLDLRGALTSDFRQIRENWFWLLALGVFLTLVGFAAVAVPALATFKVVMVLGILMIVAGAAQIVSAFTAGKWSGVMLHLLVGVLYAVVGFLVLENPLKGAAGITLLVAVLFFVEGIFRIVVAVQHKFPSWGWALLSGAVSVLLGIIIWRQLPSPGANVGASGAISSTSSVAVVVCPTAGETRRIRLNTRVTDPGTVLRCRMVYLPGPSQTGEASVLVLCRATDASLGSRPYPRNRRRRNK